MLKRSTGGSGRAGKPSRRPARFVAALALSASLTPLCGCSAGGSSGVGTVDIARAKAAAGSVESPVKAAGARGKGVIGGALKKGR